MALKAHEYAPETNAPTHAHSDSLFQIESTDGRRGYTTLEGEIQFVTRTTTHGFQNDMIVKGSKDRRIGTVIEDIDSKTGERYFLDTGVGRGRRRSKDLNKVVVSAWKRHVKDMALRVEYVIAGRLNPEDV